MNPLRAALGPVARLDRGEALYRLYGDGPALPGLRRARRGDFTLYSLDAGAVPILKAWARAPEGDFLYRALSALSAREAEDADLFLLAEAVGLSEQRSAPRARFEKRLRQRAALCLRTGRGGGALALARAIELFTDEGGALS